MPAEIDARRNPSRVVILGIEHPRGVSAIQSLGRAGIPDRSDPRPFLVSLRRCGRLTGLRRRFWGKPAVGRAEGEIAPG